MSDTTDTETDGSNRKPIANREDVYQGARHLDGVGSLDYAKLLATYRRSSHTDIEQ